MSTYPEEFKALEEENERLEAENKELKESISQCHQAYHKTSVYHRNRIKELELIKRIDDEMFYDIREQYPRTADLQAKVDWREKKVKQALKK